MFQWRIVQHNSSIRVNVLLFSAKNEGEGEKKGKREKEEKEKVVEIL